MRILILLFLTATYMFQSTNFTSIQPTNVKKEKVNLTLYDFTKEGKGNWRIQDDVVMGGRSYSKLSITKEGYARFTGQVSLENNGGFCSMQLSTFDGSYIVTSKTAFVLKVQGDGKSYKFRVRTPNGRFAYGSTFSTRGDGTWETITIPFKSMEASFRGRRINVPNYAGENIEQIQLLIGNKKEQEFELLWEKIEVR